MIYSLLDYKQAIFIKFSPSPDTAHKSIHGVSKGKRHCIFKVFLCADFKNIATFSENG